jgi:hypothetical protein
MELPPAKATLAMIRAVMTAAMMDVVEKQPRRLFIK